MCHLDTIKSVHNSQPQQREEEKKIKTNKIHVRRCVSFDVIAYIARAPIKRNRIERKKKQVTNLCINIYLAAATAHNPCMLNDLLSFYFVRR